MYKKILAPLDGSPTDEPLLEHVKALAKEWGAAVHVIQIFRIAKAEDPFERQMQMEEGSHGWRARERARIFLPKVEEAFRKEGIDVSAEFLVVEEPEANAIVKCAEEKAVDVIALANRHRSPVGSFFFGNIEEKVRRRSSVPVLFVPQSRPKGA